MKNKEYLNNFDKMLDGLSNQIFVEKPCKIIKVRSPYLVDIEIFDNNSPKTLCNVPVKHLQTSKVYIFTALTIGDRGTVRFFDNDISSYLQNSEEISSEVRKHDINDGYFSVGFYPNEEKYPIDVTGDIVIGTVSGAYISISDDAINITGGNLTISSNTTIDGRIFLEHQHSNGNNGNPTGGVI